MSLELKKIKWRRNNNFYQYDPYRKKKKIVAIFGEFREIEICFYIENFIEKNGDIQEITPDKFHLFFRDYVKTKPKKHSVVFNSIEEAKEAAQQEVLKKVLDKFFEKPISRIVLTEKSRKKKCKPKTVITQQHLQTSLYFI